MTTETIFSLTGLYGVKALLICLPILLGAGAVGFAANVAQVGFRTTTQTMNPDLSRIDPLKGMSKLFSWRGLMELIKSVVKVGAVSWVIYGFLKNEFRRMPELADMPFQSSAATIAVLCWRMMGRACAVMILIAALDLLYQRYQYEMGLRMTKQEVKDEYRLQEGDPQTKGRQKQRQRQMAR